MKTTAPISLVRTKEGVSVTHPIVYFKRTNKDILVDHLQFTKKRFEDAGYEVELIHPDPSEGDVHVRTERPWDVDWEAIKRKMYSQTEETE